MWWGGRTRVVQNVKALYQRGAHEAISYNFLGHVLCYCDALGQFQYHVLRTYCNTTMPMSNVCQMFLNTYHYNTSFGLCTMKIPCMWTCTIGTTCFTVCTTMSIPCILWHCFRTSTMALPCFCTRTMTILCFLDMYHCNTGVLTSFRTHTIAIPCFRTCSMVACF